MKMPHTPTPKTVRLTHLFFCAGLVLFPARGDHITEEIDRQWDELALEIEDAEVEIAMGCNMFKRNSYITHINPYLREKNDIYDRQALILESDRDPLDIVLRRTRALCDYLKAKVDLGALDGELSSLETQAAGIAPSSASRRKNLYYTVCAVRRKIALSNPLLDFDWNSFWYEQAFGPMPQSGSMTAPGFCGASYTNIGKALVKSHKDRLTEDQWNRVVMWLDLNTMQYGSDYDIEKQKAGELVWPMVDVDPENPVGVEIDQPVPDEYPSAINTSPAPALRSLPHITVRAGTGRLHISLPAGAPLSVGVYDMAGRAVLRTAVSTIDLRRLGNGTYMVRVNTPRLTISREIVITQ